MERTNSSIFRDDFNNDVIARLKELIIELHIAYEKRSEFAKLIETHREFYEAHDIDIKFIYIVNNNVEIFVGKRMEDADKLKASFIKAYNKLTMEKIPAILKELRLLNYIKNIPGPIYEVIQSQYNQEVCNYILRGNHFRLGEYLGGLRLKVVRRTKGNRVEDINWKESRKLRKELEEADYDIKTNDNPKGMPYIIRYESDIIAFPKWDKRICKIAHKKFYKFRSISNRNILISELNPKSIDDVFNNSGLSLVEKLSALRMHFPNHIRNLLKDE